jgi:hypothetical protein
MNAATRCDDVKGPDGASKPQVVPEDVAADPRPWEQIEPGRYMPRRVRGSCRGRELG